ncbi:DNA dC-_dU-editing enzyme APOBEC-3A-like [Pteropus vampyrus]|uniref:DNA dC->dU-editing enzyme APOBEC-3G n=1 Tax=Pteropus vampyrus TaxID=132908 RepID=A0A6P3RW80_PTEVA|nr:DNA dC->dU-editing enzyme APOBEC-3A-like [Pteropus vampyrus]
MAAGSAPEARGLMDEQTFLDNFNNLIYRHKTYLCYETERMQDDLWIPLDDTRASCRTRSLMDEQTFLDNFNNLIYVHKTYLCYETERMQDDLSIPLDEYKGFLQNEGADKGSKRRHAESIFLGDIPSWNLDTELRYRVTCFISWSPCATCADELTKFLRENRHVNLRIFAARIYERSQGYEAGLRKLKAAGAEVAIMSLQEFEYCWKNFVDHQQDEDKPFPRWDNLDSEYERLTKELEGILQNQED